MKGLILTYLVAAFATVGALRSPLVGLAAYVGFAVLRPQSIFGWAGDIRYISLIVGIATLIGWAFKGFGSWKFGRGRLPVLALLGFTVWFVLSGLAADTGQARAWDAFVELTKLVLPLLVGVTLMQSEKDWRPILWTIVLAEGYVGFEMNVDYLVKHYNTASEGFGGMDNNCFAVSLVSVIGPAFALAIASKTWKARLLAGAALAFILHTILLTFSRGGMVGMLAVAVAAFVIMPKRPRNLAGVAGVVLIAVWLTGPELAKRYSSTFAGAEERDASAQSRVDLWKDCLQVIKEHPILGVGPSNWTAVTAAKYGWPEGKSAHSVWMETAAELGLPGALLLILFFGSSSGRLWSTARARLTDTNRYEVAMATGVMLSGVGFIVGGQFVSMPSLEAPYYITMLGVAMLKNKTGASVQPVADMPRPSPYRSAIGRPRPVPAGR